MARLSSIDLNLKRSKHIVVYGASGTGKTLLVGGLAAKYKLIWLDLENGWETLLQLPKEWQDNIELIRIPDTKTLPMAIETVTKILTGARCLVDEATGKVNHPQREKENRPYTEVCMNDAGSDVVLVVDSLTQLTLSAIFNITRKQPEDYKLLLDDWGNLKVIIEKLLCYMQAAPHHIVCISHEDMVDMVDGTKKLVPVSGSSNSSRNTNRYFSDVVYCEVKNKKHYFSSSTTYANNISTKSRTAIALEKKAEPSLLDLFA